MIGSGSYRKVRRLQQNTPAAPAVRETLERLLASETFGRSERARKLIRYLVEREQAGEAERLKGFSIAMDVFGKDADFDPSTDAVVRVQAGRLRELLAQYFATEGASDPVRIIIPRGTYVPAYEHVAKTQPAANGENAGGQVRPQNVGVVAAIGSRPLALPGGLGRHRPPSSEVRVIRHLRLFWAAITIVIAMLGFVVYRTTTPETADSGDIVTAATDQPPMNGAVTARIAAEVLPTIHIHSNADHPNTARVGSVLRRALSGFDTIAFIVHDHIADERLPEKLDFVFELSTGVDPDNVVVELHHSESGKVLLSRTLSAQEVANSLDDRVATILSATIPVSGILYAHIEQNGLQSGLTNCLLLNDDYYLNQTPENHLAAYKCFQVLVHAGAKSPLVYSEIAALHLKTVTDGYDYPKGATEEQALALARRAVLMGPTSAYAHRAYGFLNSRVGTAEESIRWMKKAYELNTFDLSMAAAYAYSLIFSGNYADGVPVMKRAVELSSAHPTWWDYGLFLGQYMLDNKAGAAQAVDALATTKRPHYLAARLIVAFEAGERATAEVLINQLVTSYAKFAADPRDYFVKANYPADLADKFAGALRSAGLGRRG
jgi:hypothetical protein